MSQWGPELIAQEYEAKQTARVLLFVIDNQTRNSAGIIEAAQLAATRSESLVLVIYPYRQGQTILGETVSTQYIVSYRLIDLMLLFNRYDFSLIGTYFILQGILWFDERIISASVPNGKTKDTNIRERISCPSLYV